VTYIAVDLHVHTVYSGDSRVKVVDLVEYCREVGLGVAVTDHETFSGGFTTYRYVREFGYDMVVLCGAELMTNLGAVIVLLPEPQDVNYVPKDLRLLVRWARDRGFITIAPHPFSVTRGGLGEYLYDIEVDAIEVYNPSCSVEENERAMELANELGLPKVAGSDAHALEEVGTAYTVVSVQSSRFDNYDILEAIREGRTRPVCRPYTRGSSLYSTA